MGFTGWMPFLLAKQHNSGTLEKLLTRQLPQLVLYSTTDVMPSVVMATLSQNLLMQKISWKSAHNFLSTQLFTPGNI